MKHFGLLLMLAAAMSWPVNGVAENILDYGTREVTSGSPREDTEINVEKTDNGYIVDIEVASAWLQTHPAFPEQILWHVDKCMDFCSDRKYPSIPAVGVDLEVPQGCAGIIATVLEEKFFDFDARLGSGLAAQLPFTNGEVKDIYRSVLPFEGEYPTALADVFRMKAADLAPEADGGWYALIALARYNHTEGRVRAYSKLRLKLEFVAGTQNGIERIPAGATGGETRFFDLRGLEVADPQKGRVYIERTGSSAAKVLF